MSRSFLGFSHLLARRLYSSKPSKFGLNEEEVTQLQSAWKVVESSPIPAAKIVFKDLIKNNPKYEKRFAGYDQERPLVNQKEFVPQMRAVVTSLTKIIKKIEDEKEVEKVMEYIAESHHGEWAAAKAEMEAMGDSLKTTLKALNKNKPTANFEAAFDKFWKAFVEDYVKRVEKFKKPPDNAKK